MNSSPVARRTLGLVPRSRGIGIVPDAERASRRGSEFLDLVAKTNLLVKAKESGAAKAKFTIVQ
ncbi:MAG: hypothetical protein DMF03_02745 [Verrucomicrobia bacterium]|nr:MAG: hypothetical protein DMF03_02745 [Verrucomicrobiota bacterium]